MNLRVDYVFRPRSGRRCLGREVAERATKSREVDLSRLKGSGVTGNWSNDVWKVTGGNYRFHFQPKESYVCAFLLRRESKYNLCTLYLSDYEQRF